MKALCEKHGVEINFWYSPSKIPQPRFVIEGIAFDADTLYNEDGWEFPTQSKGVKRRPSPSRRPTRIAREDLKVVKEDIEYSPRKPQRLHW
ncbi:MAG: hypothetical protein ACE5Z5_11300 [Candidatus Bathyarchaeia archaeon]